MDWNPITGNWKDGRLRIKERWTELTDDKVATIDERRDRLVGLLQEKCGYARGPAEKRSTSSRMDLKQTLSESNDRSRGETTQAWLRRVSRTETQIMDNSKVNKANVGDRVRVEYSGHFKDEKAELQRLGREVFEFTVGSHEVIPGINKGVVGMVEGERKQMTLQPQDAYGESRAHLIQEISRQRLPSDMVPIVGKRLTTSGQKSGRRRKVRIVELTPTTVVVDGNHPLAGKTVEVEFQLLVNDASSARIERTHDIGGEA